MLKLVGTLIDRFPLDFSPDGYPQFNFEEFWITVSDIMKELVTLYPEDPAIEFQKNHDLAEYVLE